MASWVRVPRLASHTLSCGYGAYRDHVFERVLHDIGDLASGRPREIHLTYSQHYCTHCQTYFSDTADLAPPRAAIPIASLI